MENYASIRKKILELAEVFLYAEARDFIEGLKGHRRRMRAIEYNLPYLVREGKLQAIRYGHRYVYRLPQRRRFLAHDIQHGLVCTKALLAFLHCRQGQLVSERFFRQMKFGAVPEWGMLFSSGMLLFEYSTADNFSRRRLMNTKLRQYRESVFKIEDFFDAQAIVLFLFDTETHKLKHFVSEYCQDDIQFYFASLDAFKRVKRGKHLNSPIYIWAGDGKKYPLTK